MCIVLSLVHWVFFVIFFEHVLVECAILDIYHSGPYAASSATQTSCYSEATVVFASHRGNLFASSATTPDLYHTPRSSFERHPLFEENRRHHGDQHPMAMCQLQAVEDKIGHPLPNLSSTMASGFGHNNICPSAWGHPSATGDLHPQLGLRPAGLEWSSRSVWLESTTIQMQDSDTDEGKTIEEREVAQEESSWRRYKSSSHGLSTNSLWKRPSQGTGTTAATSYCSLARLWQCWTSDDDDATSNCR